MEKQRSGCRGVTLMEVLVVVAIMSLIAAGVGIAAYEYWNETRVRTAMTDARTLRGAVKSWWVLTGNDGCPTVAQLVRGRVLDADSARADPWGSPWRIECSEGEVSVISDGPDRKAGTEDDIRAPPLRRGQGFDAPDDSS